MAKTETLSPTSVSRSWLPPMDSGTALMAVLIGVMGFYVLYPLTLIVVNSFNTATIAEPPVYGLKTWREAFSEYGIWRSLWNSVKIGIVLQVIALPLGIFISWLLARTNILFANALEFGFWISFFMPGLATTFGWMLLLDPSTGLINSWLRQVPLLSGLNFDIYSFAGIIWVHLVSNGMSTKVMLMTPAFRRMDASMEEASRMSGASAFTTMWRITVPAMTPVIVVVFLLSVIRIFSSFEIELLLGVPWSFYVYSTKIVDLARQEPPLVNQAAALGSIILLFLAAFIPLQRKLITRRQFTTVTGQFKPKIIDLGAWRYPATAFVAFIVFILDVVPLLSVLGGSFMTRFGFFNLPKTWTLEYWKMALSDPRILHGLHNTLIVAVSAGLVGALAFSLIGYVLVRTKLPGRSVLDSICWLPSAIPGVLSGLGLLWMFLGTPFFRPFYGTIVLLVIAQVLGGITLATQILKANFIQLGKELEESSRMSGAGFWRTYLRIVFPLMAQTMVMVGVIKFMFAAQHNSAIILLATSETRTLSLLALDQVAAGYREVASITIIMVTVLTLGVAVVARSFGLKVGIRAE
ncbi:MAG TPA: iron ABC transporter permease [Candidatus Binatia bacterium]|jgi:iron(III) transport system permease protein|nr:iron ABC transporter permease [Candidatus Binatia bacterium]